MSTNWRDRVKLSGFADVVPHLEAYAPQLDAGVVDEAWLDALALAPDDALALGSALRPPPAAPTHVVSVVAPIAASVVAAKSPTAAAGPDLAAFARARVTRALAEGDPGAAAAALAAMGTPQDPGARAEFATWLSGITLARTSNDGLVVGAVGVAHAIQVASEHSGPLLPAVSAALQAIADHAAHLQRAENAAAAKLRQRLIMGAVGAVVLTLIGGVSYMATRSSRFVVGQTAQDGSCGGMFEVCVRAKCEVSNLGNTLGTANVEMNGTIRKYDGAERAVKKSVTLSIEPGFKQVAIFNVPEVEVMESLTFECAVSG